MKRSNKDTSTESAVLAHLDELSEILPPTTDAIRAARARAGLTQTQAGRLLRTGLRTWQNWELGEREMPRALFEFFCLLVEHREVRVARLAMYPSKKSQSKHHGRT